MRNKKIITLLSTLLVFTMVVSPILAITAMNETADPASLSSTENLIVHVLEDESVYSDSPDDNYHANLGGGGVWAGYDGFGYARAWLKYDLSFIPKEIGFLNVYINLYCNDEYNISDLPVGIYYSDDNTWTETSITWNNQPSFDASPAETIDSPASPDMFVPGNWYSWDVTVPFSASLADDKMLTLVLKQIDEAATNETWTYYAEKDYDVFLASYLSVEYTTPDTTTLTVDGHSTAPLKDYIQDSTPNLAWVMADSGPGEYQRDYALEVNSNQYFNGTTMWSENHGDTVTIYDASINNNIRPFATANEMRYQMQFGASLVTKSGVVDKLYFETNEASGTAVFENLVVLMVNTDSPGVLTSDFEANYGAARPVTVLNRSSYSAPIVDNYLVIDIENIFFLSSRNSLIIELRFTNNTGTLAGVPYLSGAGGSATYTFGSGAYTSTSGTYTDPRTNSLKVELTSTEATPSLGISTNHFPFDTDNGVPGVFQMKYNSSLIANTGTVDRIYIPVTSFTGDEVFEGLKVYLVETPVLGRLSHTNFADNYGGVTPTLVLDEDFYHIRNIGGVLVIDVDNIFTYRGEHDLLIELRWDNKVSGDCLIYYTSSIGGYRSYNLTMSIDYNGNDTTGVDMIFDFVHSDNPVEYAGTSLVNTTTYYWRVKTCDSTGIWSDWTTSSFKYEKLDSTPAYSGLIVSPSPAYVGSPVSISLNVTYFLGLSGVWIEMDGVNHSMSVVGDTFTYTWTPATAGNVTYTVYMESAIDTWSSVSGTVEVLSSGLVIDPNLLLILAGVGIVVVIILVVILKGRGKK